MRNPFKCGFVPKRKNDGHIICGNVGWFTYEGAIFNYKRSNGGWPCIENGVVAHKENPKFKACTDWFGGRTRYPGSPSENFPVWWNHNGQSSAIIGGEFLGEGYPEGFQNCWVYADFTSGEVKCLPWNQEAGRKTGEAPRLLMRGLQGPVAFRQGPEGALYFMEMDLGSPRPGFLRRLIPPNFTAKVITPRTTTTSTTRTTTTSTTRTPVLSTSLRPFTTVIANRTTVVFETVMVTVTSTTSSTKSTTIATKTTKTTLTTTTKTTKTTSTTSSVDPCQPRNRITIPQPKVDGIYAVNYLSSFPNVTYMRNGGFGPIEIDSSVGGPGEMDGGQMRMGGVRAWKGVGTHSTSEISIPLDGSCWKFTADVGIDDEVFERCVGRGNDCADIKAGVKALGEFVIRKDNSVAAWNSSRVLGRPIRAGDAPLKMEITNLTGVKNLILNGYAPKGNTLIMDKWYNHLNWANAKLYCGPDAPYLPRVEITAPVPVNQVPLNAMVRFSGRATTWDGKPIPASALTWIIEVSRDD
jgi:hypothetical protein